MKNKKSVFLIIVGMLIIVAIINTYVSSRSYNKNDVDVDKDAYISEINTYVEQVKTTEEKNIETIEVNLTDLELGQEATEFMNTLEVNEIPGIVKIYDKKAVIISPYSDFLDIQSYYYKDNQLVLYSREFMGIGGFANYYFKGGELVDIKTQVEEEMNFTPETAESILQRANNVYQKYIVN